jgi:hypothetical protein
MRHTTSFVIFIHRTLRHALLFHGGFLLGCAGRRRHHLIDFNSKSKQIIKRRVPLGYALTLFRILLVTTGSAAFWEDPCRRSGDRRREALCLGGGASEVFGRLHPSMREDLEKGGLIRVFPRSTR